MVSRQPTTQLVRRPFIHAVVMIIMVIMIMITCGRPFVPSGGSSESVARVMRDLAWPSPISRLCGAKPPTTTSARSHSKHVACVQNFGVASIGDSTVVQSYSSSYR